MAHGARTLGALAGRAPQIVDAVPCTKPRTDCRQKIANPQMLDVGWQQAANLHAGDGPNGFPDGFEVRRRHRNEDIGAGHGFGHKHGFRILRDQDDGAAIFEFPQFFPPLRFLASAGAREFGIGLHRQRPIRTSQVGVQQPGTHFILGFDDDQV